MNESLFPIFRLGFFFRNHIIVDLNNYYVLSTLVHGNKAKLKRPSWALLRCKSNFSIFEVGLISLQI